jgi:hypothetical protein
LREFKESEMADEVKTAEIVHAPNPYDVTQAQADFECSEGIGKLVEALSKAQLEFEPVKKNVVNTFYSTEKKVSKYSDLSAIFASTQKALAKNGLVVMQWPSVDASKQMAGSVSRLAHVSGEWTQCKILFPATEKRKEYAKDGTFVWVNQFTAQTCGIAFTYSRRYSYQGVTGVAAEDDDDANAISVHDQGSSETAQAVGAQKVAAIKQKIADVAAKKDMGAAGHSDTETPQNGSGEVYGLLKAAKKIKLKNGKGDALALEVLDPNDKSTALFCFDNRKYPDGSSLFDILEMAAEGHGQSVRLRTKASGKFTNVVAPIAIGSVTFDSDGVPEIQTNADSASA